MGQMGMMGKMGQMGKWAIRIFRFFWVPSKWLIFQFKFSILIFNL